MIPIIIVFTILFLRRKWWILGARQQMWGNRWNWGAADHVFWWGRFWEKELLDGEVIGLIDGGVVVMFWRDLRHVRLKCLIKLHLLVLVRIYKLWFGTVAGVGDLIFSANNNSIVVGKRVKICDGGAECDNAEFMGSWAANVDILDHLDV